MLKPFYSLHRKFKSQMKRQTEGSSTCALMVWMGMLLVLAARFSPVYGQLPSVPKLPTHPTAKSLSPSLPGQGQLSALSTSSQDMEAYQSYLKRIKAFKEEYGEMDAQLDSLQTSDMQESLKDSLWNDLKARAQENAKAQISLMEDIQQGLPEGFGSIQAFAGRYQGFLASKKEVLGAYTDYDQMAGYLDSAEENLKAFTNEQLSQYGQDQLETYLKGQSTTALEGQLGDKAGTFPTDLYGQGLEALDQSPETLQKEASTKLNALGTEKLASTTGKLPKGLTIPDAADATKMKDKLQWAKLFGKNELKGAPLKARLTAEITANSLDAFGDGINASLLLGYRFTHYLSLMAGPNWKEEWSPSDQLSKEGHGVQLALRYRSHGGWLGQLSMEHNYVNARYPDTHSQLNYHGHQTYPLLGVGKEVPLFKGLKAIFMGLYDPSFQSTTRLHSNQFLLRVGLLKYFKKLKK